MFDLKNTTQLMQNFIHGVQTTLKQYRFINESATLRFISQKILLTTHIFYVVKLSLYCETLKKGFTRSPLSQTQLEMSFFLQKCWLIAVVVSIVCKIYAGLPSFVVLITRFLAFHCYCQGVYQSGNPKKPRKVRILKKV